MRALGAAARATEAGSSAPAPGAAVRAAVAKTGTTTARLHERIEITGGGATYALTVAGAFDFAHGRGSPAVDFPEGGISHTDETFADGKVCVKGAGWEKTFLSSPTPGSTAAGASSRPA